MKRRIKIEDVLFPDGIIEAYEMNHNEFKMQFKDYSDSELIFCFSSDIEIKTQTGIGLSVYESHLEKLENRMKLRLLDDDLIEMLNIEFGSCTISLLS